MAGSQRKFGIYKLNYARRSSASSPRRRSNTMNTRILLHDIAFASAPDASVSTDNSKANGSKAGNRRR
jgi:hypothetical protein